MRASQNNVARKRANGTWARAGTWPGRDPATGGKNNDSKIFHEIGLHKPEFDETWAG